jgi:hypothetical protein
MDDLELKFNGSRMNVDFLELWLTGKAAAFFCGVEFSAL